MDTEKTLAALLDKKKTRVVKTQTLAKYLHWQWRDGLGLHTGVAELWELANEWSKAVDELKILLKEIAGITVIQQRPDELVRILEPKEERTS